MTHSEAKPYVIVTGLDLSELGDRAFEGALEAAVAYGDSELHVVHVTQAAEAGHVVLNEPNVAKGKVSVNQAAAYVEDYVHKLHRAYAVNHKVIPYERITCHLRVGDAADEIVKVAEEKNAQEVMVGTHGRTGIRKLLMGSVAEAVLDTAPCTVVIVRPKSHGEEIEPAMTPAEKAVYEKFHKHHHGERHVYLYGGPTRRAPSSIVGGT